MNKKIWITIINIIIVVLISAGISHAGQVFKNTSGTSIYKKTINTPSFNSDASGVTATKIAYFADKVGIGVTNIADYHSDAHDLVVGGSSGAHGITVVTGGSNTGRIYFADGTGSSSEKMAGIEYDHFNNILKISAGASAGGKRITINSNGNVGMGDDSGFLSGMTTQLLLSSGVSPTGVVSDGAVFYAYQDEMWVASPGGTHTELSCQDPETGEDFLNSFNRFTGIGKKRYLDSGKIEYYTVDKINPEEFARQTWITQWRKDNPIKTEVSRNETFETVMEDIEIEDIETGKVRYRLIGTESVGFWESGKKVIQQSKVKLKANIYHDTKTGKFYLYETPSMEAALQAANKDFYFDWRTMPEFVRKFYKK